jgi:hypothetical protein
MPSALPAARIVRNIVNGPLCGSVFLPQTSLAPFGEKCDITLVLQPLDGGHDHPKHTRDKEGSEDTQVGCFHCRRSHSKAWNMRNASSQFIALGVGELAIIRSKFEMS